jgi:membrane protein DedA with SNARE-associated domain
MEEFLRLYGYIALSAGTFMEGETAILVASSLIHSGLFKGVYTVFFGFLGSFVSDWLFYMIGRLNGKYFIEKRPKLQKSMDPIHLFFKTHRYEILISYRFLYGFRTLLPLMIGMSGVKPLTFLGFSLLSGLLWATAVSSVGYWGGIIFELTPKSFEENLLFVMGGFAVFGLLVGFSVKSFAEKRIGLKPL